jgi:DNA-directed RNA polymerase subunit M/transcription elongation factor TFIIS
MITFACPRCKQTFHAPPTGAGTTIICPKCQLEMQVPKPAAQPTQVPKPGRFVGVSGGEADMIRFACPKCGKRLKAPATAVGKAAKCQTCGTATVISSGGIPSGAVTSATPPPLLLDAPENEAVAALYVCPFCAEEIQAEAKKCKHCGEFLDPALRVVAESDPTIRPARPPKAHAVMGICSMVSWCVGLAFLILAVIQWDSARQAAGGMAQFMNLRDYAAHNDTVRMHLDRASSLRVSAMICGLTGLVLATLSFLERAKRYWSVVGLVCNILMQIFLCGFVRLV